MGKRRGNRLRVHATPGHRHSCSTRVVGCAHVEFVRIPLTFSRRGQEYSPFQDAFPSMVFDSTRHLKPGAKRPESQTKKGLNLLFVDGHAESVGIIEAWMACRDPGGKDLSTP